MSPARRQGISAAAIAALALFALAATAQESADDADETGDATETEEARDEALDEVVVIAPWPGGPRRLDPLYEDPLRKRIQREIELLMQDREESAWRAEFADEKPSRIRLGYDPRDEYRLRNELDLNPPPSETAKPATIIRIGF